MDDGNRAAYQAEGLEPFSYEAKGRTVEIGAYWRVPERLFDDPDEMVEWARAALAAGQRAAVKKKPKRRSARLRSHPLRERELHWPHRRVRAELHGRAGPVRRRLRQLGGVA